jgi:hypothetical protein
MMEKIRDISSAVIDAYVKDKIPLNDSILHLFDSIDNNEILKRICELVNQNVYLSLFHTSGIDRSNIVFDVADYEKLKSEINKRKMAMNDYSVGPKDYRNSLEIVAVPVEIKRPIDKTAGIDQKYLLINELNRFEKLAGFLEIVKSAEIGSVDQNFDKILKDSLAIVHKGESLGDMAKLASRNIQEMGLNPAKIMRVYDEVSKAIGDEGYYVRNDFTKISSQKINKNSDILKPSKEIALSIEKIAALNEMIENVKKVIAGYKNELKKQ